MTAGPINLTVAFSASEAAPSARRKPATAMPATTDSGSFDAALARQRASIANNNANDNNAGKPSSARQSPAHAATAHDKSAAARDNKPQEQASSTQPPVENRDSDSVAQADTTADQPVHKIDGSEDRHDAKADDRNDSHLTADIAAHIDLLAQTGLAAEAVLPAKAAAETAAMRAALVSATAAHRLQAIDGKASNRHIMILSSAGMAEHAVKTLDAAPIMPADTHKIAGAAQTAPHNTANGLKSPSQTAGNAGNEHTRTSIDLHAKSLKHDAAQSARGTTAPNELIASSKTDTTAASLTQQAQQSQSAQQQDGLRTLRNLASLLTPNNQSATPALQGLTSGGQMATALQPVSTPLAATNAAVFTAQLQAPLGTKGWNQALQQQSLRLTRFGNGQAQLTLSPPDLGKLQVSVKMGAETQLHFVSPNAHVRAAVQAALPQLQQAFADSGINLGQTSVSDQGRQSFGSDGQRHARGAGGSSSMAADTDEMTAPVTVTRIVGRTAAGGIDIFA